MSPALPRAVAVTGCVSGIGRATAKLLREQGDRVLGVDLAGAETCADLASPAGRRAAVDAVADRSGGSLAALVTCAGLSQAGPAQVSVNYFGTIDLVEGLLPVLAADGGGRVVLVGSVSALHGHDAALVELCLEGDEPAALERAAELQAAGRGHEIYASTKVALERWMAGVSTSAAYAGAGVSVNTVAPGVVLTPMTEQLIADDRMRAVMDEAVPMPLHGHAPPEAVARALVWLADLRTTHVTGQVLHVDGGAHVVLQERLRSAPAHRPAGSSRR